MSSAEDKSKIPGHPGDSATGGSTECKSKTNICQRNAMAHETKETRKEQSQKQPTKALSNPKKTISVVKARTKTIAKSKAKAQPCQRVPLKKVGTKVQPTSQRKLENGDLNNSKDVGYRTEEKALSTHTQNSQATSIDNKEKLTVEAKSTNSGTAKPKGKGKVLPRRKAKASRKKKLTTVPSKKATMKPQRILRGKSTNYPLVETKTEEQINNPSDDDNDPDDGQLLIWDERVRIYEAEVLAWVSRKEQLEREKEKLLAQKKNLLKKQVEIMKKQLLLEEARAKNLILHTELNESLTTSRERLKTLLETAGEEKPQSLENEKFIHSESPEDDANHSTPEQSRQQQALGDESMIRCEQIRFVTEKSYKILIHDSYCSIDALNEYHKKRAPRLHASSLSMPMIPHLNPSQVQDFLILMLRETNAIDLSRKFLKVDEKQKRCHPRRKLLEKTSLDVLLLSRTNTAGTPYVKGTKNLEGNLSSYSQTGLSSGINPIISFCPYELEGVCADDLCPYQHLKKGTLERECLPLPSLKSFSSTIITGVSRVATQEHHKSRSKSPNLGRTEHLNNTTTMMKDVTMKETNTVNQEEEDEEEEEDLIMLPPTDVNSEKSEYQVEQSIETNAIGEDENVDLCDSSSTCDSSDNELDHRQLQLSAVFDTSSESSELVIIRENEPLSSTHLWWGGNFPIYSREEKMFSIQDIFLETFDILVEDELRAAGNECTIDDVDDSPIINERFLRIKTYRSGKEKMSWREELKFLGRLIDAIRFALHGGLDELAISISNPPQFIVSPLPLPIQNMLAMVKRQVHFIRFHANHPRFSFFHVLFTGHLALSIESWSMNALFKNQTTPENVDEDAFGSNGQDTTLRLLWDVFQNLWNTLRVPSRKPSNRCEQGEFSDETLQLYLLEPTRIQIKGRARVEISEEVSCLMISTIHEIENLDLLVKWAQMKYMVHSFDQPDVTGQLLEERLNTAWTICHSFLNKVKRNGERIDSLDWELKCLKVAVIMGYNILGALESFALTVINQSHKASESNDVEEDAAWASLGGTIGRILRKLRNLLTPTVLLMDVVLAPLYACSNASLSHIRDYSSVQKSLAKCIGGNYHRWSTFTSPTFNVMAYSDLLWSQLIQLRMSLPNESISIDTATALSPTGYKSLAPIIGQSSSKPHITNEFLWEPSKAVIDEVKSLVAKLASRGIVLRHVVLWGDSSFSQIAQSNKSFLYWFLAKNSQSEPPPDLCLAKYLEDVEKSCSDRHPFPEPLPQLPLVLLHVGHGILNLNLKGCGLNRLPQSFALYFPNLKFLDLSHNELKELPDSFRGITDLRMTSLEKFDASHNQFASLPAKIFSSQKPASGSPLQSGSRLTFLDLSYNRLTILPSFVSLASLQVLRLNNNALVDRTVSEWSRLTLALPALHELKYDNQTKRDCSSIISQKNKP